MRVDVFDLSGEKKKTIELPRQFSEEYRPNLIKRAVLALLSNLRQSYGSKIGAGMRHSAKLSRRRKNYKTAYGLGISRVPRKTMTRRGRRFFWVGANAPGTVGGRRAHPPKSIKFLDKKINKIENRKAIRSALAGIYKGDKIRFVVNELENLEKTKNVLELLKLLGWGIKVFSKVRAGRGKSRGRKYKPTRNVLFVVSKKCKLFNSASNLKGVDVVEVDKLNACLIGENLRETVWSEEAIERMRKETLFE